MLVWLSTQLFIPAEIHLLWELLTVVSLYFTETSNTIIHNSYVFLWGWGWGWWGILTWDHICTEMFS